MKKRKRMMGIALAGMMMLSAVAIPQTLPQEVQESYSIVQTIEADAAEWKIGGFSGGTAWTKGWICINAKQNLWKTKYKSPRIYVYAYSQDGKTTKKRLEKL